MQKLSDTWAAPSFVEKAYTVVAGEKMFCWMFCRWFSQHEVWVWRWPSGSSAWAEPWLHLLHLFPEKTCGYLAFILHFSSLNHFTEPLWWIPPTSWQNSYYSILLASLWKLLMAFSSTWQWTAFTKGNFSKDSCPESKSNYHLKL